MNTISIRKPLTAYISLGVLTISLLVGLNLLSKGNAMNMAVDSSGAEYTIKGMVFLGVGFLGAFAFAVVSIKRGEEPKSWGIFALFAPILFILFVMLSGFFGR